MQHYFLHVNNENCNGNAMQTHWEFSYSVLRTEWRNASPPHSVDFKINVTFNQHEQS